jgi:hypothetical protein
MSPPHFETRHRNDSPIVSRKRFSSLAPGGLVLASLSCAIHNGFPSNRSGEAEQEILFLVGELWLQGRTIDAIRQLLAYTWKVRNRNNREFGCSEVRRMAIRGARAIAEGWRHDP